MHPLLKKIVKKNSVFAVAAVILQIGAIACLLKATVGTAKEVRGTVNKALDAYAEMEHTK